jgi:pimeloyl-ACP methyl ester carboxylesterase
VLVHGYLAHRGWLGLLARRLRRQGFRTVNWGYPTLFRSVREPASRLRRALNELATRDGGGAVGDGGPLHLVVHSMGGIVARAALEEGVPDRLHRMVMLGTPNGGSEVARRLAPWLGGISPPVRELSAGDEGIVHSLGVPVGIEIGVLAARYDLLVSQTSTRPPVPHQFASIPCSHSGLVLRRDAARYVGTFLKTGRFP